MARRLRIVAVAGSLRARSSNKVLLTAAAALAPPGIEVTLYEQLDTLPHFNIDCEPDGVRPTEASAWRDLVAHADGLLLSVPEYAGGIPGSFKNALDWLVGDPRFDGKPVGILNASHRSVQAQDALRVVLRTMSARIVEDASVTVSLLGTTLDSPAVVQNPALADPLRNALLGFARSIEAAV